MSESLRASAIDVTSHILETMFFVTLEPWTGRGGEDSPSAPASWLEGRIRFVGPRTGEVRLYVPLELAQAMAANFLGLEEGIPTDAQARDVVGELTNMICGNLLSRLDRKVIYNLSVPEAACTASDPMGKETDGSALAIDFNAEGQGVRLVLDFEPQGPARTS